MSTARSPRPTGRYTIVKDSKALANAMASLAEETFVTIDTEFIRERTYWPILCLVQIGGSKDTFLVDVMAPGINLSPLEALLADEKILKVFHSGQQDIEIFLHDFGQLPTPVYDTQVAAMVCGFGDQVGYAGLIRDLTGHVIDKGQRYTDWARRPLMPAQYHYAAEDVTWLRIAYEVLRKKLSVDGRDGWVDEELEVYRDENFFKPSLHKMYKRAVGRLKTRNRYKLGVIKELVTLREEQAQKLDIPRQYVLKDEQIDTIALKLPKALQALGSLRGIPQKFADNALGKHIVDIINAVLRRKEEELPSDEEFKLPDELTPPPKAVMCLLRALLEACCEHYRVAPRMIANTQLLEKVARKPSKIPKYFKGWRWEIFGKSAQALCEGELSLALDGDVIKLQKKEEH